MTTDGREEVPPSDTTEFGVDARGRSHRYSRINNTVYVSDGREFDLAETPFGSLGDWCEHIEGVCGWRELRYAEDDAGGFGALADRLEKAATTNAGP